MTSHLFSPIKIGQFELPNRIAIAPMCQYSADDGSASDWHLFHWTNMASSGASMVTFEMTDVERRGRISHSCLGMYSDENEAAAKRALDMARRSASPGQIFGLQLAHAGRKASCQRPWEGGGPLQDGEDPWPVVSASALAYDEGYPVPHALTEDEIGALVEKFAAAARRAERAGFDFIEIHGAHGYLLFQFLSPLSNKRTDRYGGSLENRMRFIVEVVHAVRKAAPTLLVGARLSVREWVEGGFDEEQASNVAKALETAGVSYICCSSGGNSPLQRVPAGRGYQVFLAEYIKQRVSIPVRAVGMIDTPEFAETILREGKADIIAIGRPALADPHWPWWAAAAAGQPIPAPKQYVRSADLRKRWLSEQA